MLIDPSNFTFQYIPIGKGYLYLNLVWDFQMDTPDRNKICLLRLRKATGGRFMNKKYIRIKHSNHKSVG